MAFSADTKTGPKTGPKTETDLDDASAGGQLNEEQQLLLFMLFQLLSLIYVADRPRSYDWVKMLPPWVLRLVHVHVYDNCVKGHRQIPEWMKLIAATAIRSWQKHGPADQTGFDEKGRAQVFLPIIREDAKYGLMTITDPDGLALRTAYHGTWGRLLSRDLSLGEFMTRYGEYIRARMAFLEWVDKNL